MIKKIIVSAVVLSLFFIGGLRATAETGSNSRDKAQIATCMQVATAEKNAAFKAAKDTFSAAIKGAKEKGESTWWPWGKARVEARKERREDIRIAKEAFAEDREACKAGVKNDDDKDDNGDKADEDEDKKDEDKADNEEKEISVNLTAQNTSGVSGKASLEEENGKLEVELKLTGFMAGVAQPAHIHLGSCANIGAVKYPLTSAIAGKSETTLVGMTLAQLKTELPLAINVHKSEAEAGTYVACGDINL